MASAQRVTATLAADQYEVFECFELGRTAQSVVCKGYDHHLQRHVAVKQLVDSSVDANGFWSAARYCAQLSHPNIVGVLNLDESRGWVITELMQSSLADRTSDDAVRPQDIQLFLVGALKALVFVHADNHLHGAIKPSNLMVAAGGSLKLADVRGIAIGEQFETSLVDSRHVAPEVVNPTRFGQPGTAIDLYCLATSLVHALLGKKFDRIARGNGLLSGTPNWAKWHACPTSQFPPVRELVPDLDASVAAVLDRMLAKRVDDRYSSAVEVLADLESTSTTVVPAAEKDSSSFDAFASRIMSYGSKGGTSQQSVNIIRGPNSGIKESDTTTRSAESNLQQQLLAGACAAMKNRRLVIMAAACTVLITLGVVNYLIALAPKPFEVRITTLPDASVTVQPRHDITAPPDKAKARGPASEDGTQDYLINVPRSGEYMVLVTKTGFENYHGSHSFQLGEVISIELSEKNGLGEREIEEIPIELEVAPYTAHVSISEDHATSEESAVVEISQFMRDDVKNNRQYGTHDVHPEKQYTITVQADGYVTQTLTIDPAEVTEAIEISLAKKREVRVVVTPTNAIVYFNGIPMEPAEGHPGIFRAELPPETTEFKLMATHDGYQTYQSDPIRVEKDTAWPHAAFVNLVAEEKPDRTFQLHTDPQNADVYVDDKYVGQSPMSLELEPGFHQFEVRKPGYVTWSERLMVAENDPGRRVTLKIDDPCAEGDCGPAYQVRHPHVSFRTIGVES